MLHIHRFTSLCLALNNKKRKNISLNGVLTTPRGSKAILAVFIVLFFVSFLPNISFSSDLSEIPPHSKERSELTPSSSSLISENLTINSGDELYEDQNYEFNGSFYDSSNKTKEFSEAYLETKLIGDDVLYANDSISNLNNTEIQYNQSIDVINGSFVSWGNLNHVDNNYTTFNSSICFDYNATYTFWNDADGSNPAGWSILEGGTSTVNIISDIGGHDKVVEFNDRDGASEIQMDNSISRNTGTLELWVRSEATTDTIWIQLRGTNYVLFYLRGNGQFGYYAGGYNDIGAYAADTWYHIRIEFDTNTDWHLWIDGVSQDGGAGYALHAGTSADPFTILRFGTVYAAEQCISYIDAAGYSWDTYYTIGDNLYPVNASHNSTITMQFQNYNKALLAFEVSSYYKTDIYQNITFSIFNFSSSSWFVINSSFNDVDFYESYYFNDTNAFSDFINSTGHIILNYFGENSTSEFELYVDFLHTKIYYKLELSISKSFSIKGNWKYRFHLVGSDYYSDWVYFEVVKDLSNYASAINLTHIINEMFYEDYYSQIMIRGNLTASEVGLYVVGIESVYLPYTYWTSAASEDVDKKTTARTIFNDNIHFGMGSTIIDANSTFVLTGFLEDEFEGGGVPADLLGNILPEENITVNFYCYRYGNESSISYLSDDGINTDYKLHSKSPTTNGYTFRDDLMLFSNSIDGDNDALNIEVNFGLNNFIITNPSDNPNSFQVGLINNVPCRTSSGSNAISTTLSESFWSKNFEYFFQSYQNDFEIRKDIRFYSRNELIESSPFILELNITTFLNYVPVDEKLFNLTYDYFYTYPDVEFQETAIVTYNFSLNIFHNNISIKNHSFNWDFSEKIDITLPDKYNPKSIYFGVYNFDGFGLDKSMFKFYINETRKDFGFNTIAGDYANLVIRDFWDYIIYNQTIQINDTTYEFNIEVEVYNLIINNNYLHNIKVEIYRSGFAGNITQLIPGISGFSFRFYPGVQYNIITYYTNDTVIENKTITLDYNNKPVNFGFYEEQVPVIPESNVPVALLDIIIIIILFSIIIAALASVIIYISRKYKKTVRMQELAQGRAKYKRKEEDPLAIQY